MRSGSQVKPLSEQNEGSDNAPQAQSASRCFHKKEVAMEEDTEGYMPFSFRHGALSYSIPARRHAPCPGKEHQEEADKAVALEDFTVQCLLFFSFTFQWLNWHLQDGVSIIG